MSVTILKGDCRDVLRELPAESVHCVVTSPPYWGLRDYGVAGQIGLETSYIDFVDAMRKVFCEVRRVLRKDGTVWLNLGDSYNNRTKVRTTSHQPALNGFIDDNWAERAARGGVRMSNSDDGMKEKDLCGIPWRVAFALQADGWYLRQDIIWSKPNPMPESVRDRCTKAHEYIFLLSKSERYYYDVDAIKEAATYPEGPGNIKPVKGAGMAGFEIRGGFGKGPMPSGVRNKRSVWEINTHPFPEAHFATFPPALIEPCILAGCPEKCCAKCGAPWVRQTDGASHYQGDDGSRVRKTNMVGNGHGGAGRGPKNDLGVTIAKTVGFSPSCSCGTHRIGLGEDHWTTECIISGTVLDPFGGAGTTGLVADRLGLNAILIELNPEYAAMAEYRIKGDAGMFAEITMSLDKGKPTGV